MNMKNKINMSCPDWVEDRGLENEDWVEDRWGDCD